MCKRSMHTSSHRSAATAQLRVIEAHAGRRWDNPHRDDDPRAAKRRRNRDERGDCSDRASRNGRPRRADGRTLRPVLLAVVRARDSPSRRSRSRRELVQETFLRLWRSAPRFDRELGSGTTFIYTIARRVAIDLRRRRSSRPHAALVDDDRPGPDQTAPSHEGEVELAIGVREALDTLSHEQRVRC